jgi:hypothetical protein
MTCLNFPAYRFSFTVFHFQTLSTIHFQSINSSLPWFSYMPLSIKVAFQIPFRYLILFVKTNFADCRNVFIQFFIFNFTVKNILDYSISVFPLRSRRINPTIDDRSFISVDRFFIPLTYILSSVYSCNWTGAYRLLDRILLCTVLIFFVYIFHISSGIYSICYLCLYFGNRITSCLSN